MKIDKKVVSLSSPQISSYEFIIWDGSSIASRKIEYNINIQYDTDIDFEKEITNEY